MGAIQDARAELRADLAAAGLHAFDHVPDRIRPSAALVRAGDPYLLPSGTVNPAEFLVSAEVVLLADTGTNELEIDRLDAMIDAAVMATDWTITDQGVSAPYVARVDQRNFLAATLYLSRHITITESEQ